jgi:hypothetical protein
MMTNEFHNAYQYRMAAKSFEIKVQDDGHARNQMDTAPDRLHGPSQEVDSACLTLWCRPPSTP